MEQLNISQLQNLWLRSPDERLASWREFRIELQCHYDLMGLNGTESVGCKSQSCLEIINTWWQLAPTVSVAMDPFNSLSWPTVWEIVYQGECCKYSRGLAMAYTMYYIDDSLNITVDRVRDQLYGDEYMIANIDGHYALNSPHAPVTNLHSVESLEIRESFEIRELILNR
jgi:hypothetical protein